MKKIETTITIRDGFIIEDTYELIKKHWYNRWKYFRTIKSTIIDFDHKSLAD